MICNKNTIKILTRKQDYIFCRRLIYYKSIKTCPYVTKQMNNNQSNISINNYILSTKSLIMKINHFKIIYNRIKITKNVFNKKGTNSYNKSINIIKYNIN